MVVGVEGRLAAHLPAQQPAGQRQADDQRHAAVPRLAEQLRQRLLAEEVEDDLQRHQPLLPHAVHRLGHRLDAGAPVPDLSLLLERSERLEDFAALEYVEGHAVELRQVQRLDAEVLERRLGVAAHRVRGEVGRPARVGEAAELRGDEEVAFRVGGLALGEEAADERLAAAQAVDVGGVEEGDAGVGRRAEGVERLLVRNVAPVGAAELPAAQADLADACAEAAERSLSHGADHSGAGALR